ncbi:hypothetical protein [Streptomyces sp. NPDC001315]|uniref:hypothetical protein n=1 Tax=Streptomyces sp. NPDC001315 TaxID=3364562 RepID=UPI0036C49266
MTADHWAYDHRDEKQREAEGYVWSDDPAHYIPLCAVDHRAFDRAFRRGTAIAPLKATAARRLTEAQKAWYSEQCAQQSLIDDKVNAAASRERSEKRDAQRAAEREKLDRQSDRAARPIDSLAGFFPLVAVLGGDSHRITGVDAYGLYEGWCRAECITRILGRTQFYAALVAIPGITRKRTTKGVEFLGLRRTADL